MKLNLDRKLFYNGGISAIDQGLLSAVNFLVQIILIKNIEKTEYGYYALALTFISYFISIQNAIINTPITVLLAGKKKEEKEDYISSVYSGQFFLVIPLIMLGIIIVFIFYLFGLNLKETLVFVALCFSIFGILLREFLRAYFYAEENPSKALKLDFYYILLYIGLIIILLLTRHLSAAFVILFLGISSGFDSVLLNKELKLKFDLKKIRKSFNENWRYGKWSLVGVTTTHIQNNAYLYLIGSILGTSAMADVSASRILMMPLGLLITGWGNVSRPHGARLREEGKLKRYYKELATISTAFTVLLFFSATLISIFSSPINKILFSKEYENVFDYIYIWAAIFSVSFIRANASYGLQVIKHFKSLAKINILTLFITILFSYLLIPTLGISGALFASLIGESVFAITLWILLTSSIFNIQIIEKIKFFFELK